MVQLVFKSNLSEKNIKNDVIIFLLLQEIKSKSYVEKYSQSHCTQMVGRLLHSRHCISTIQKNHYFLF